MEQDIECCAIQLEYKFSNIYVLAIYRALTGDFEQFISKLDCIIHYIYKPRAGFMICGDVNTDFLTKGHHKQCLVSLLTSFNLTSTVKFPTKIQNGLNTTIDNVFINSARKDHYSIEPVISGLSDHDAQLIVINKVKPVVINYNCRKQTRLVNDLTIKEFTTYLRNENWESVYNDSCGVELKFDTFQSIFLRIFEASFPTNMQKKVFKSNE
jgi:hypothetical protein